MFARAQDGLARTKGDILVVHATVHAFVPVERSVEVRADQLPLSKLHLTRWIEHPRRIACASDLECARADLDVDAALRDLGPLLPSLPVGAHSIHAARVEVAVAEQNGQPRRLRLHGDLDPGGMVPGSVPFDVEVDLKQPRAG